jgi:hypothetical protein
VNHDRRPAPGRAFLTLLLCAALAAPASAATVYKWVDEHGTTHLSTTKPPPGVKYETLAVGSPPASGGKSPSGGSSSTSKKAQATSPAQSAQRQEVISSLQNRECVIALEALDRLTSGTQPTSAEEIRRLKQTTDANCSINPARRREQEEMAAKLRAANGPECVKARNELADMSAPGSKTPSAQLRAQQEFVDAHCIPPVR